MKTVCITVLDLNDYDLRSNASAELSIAFAAFCKECRGDVLTQNEKHALLYCQKLSIFPILPAVFDLDLPYAGYDIYSCTPPDILHTFLGGLLKDWIFHVCVIVSSLCFAGLGNGRNLHTLDELIQQFPIMQSMPFFMRKFQKGVTEYVRKAGDGTSSEKGRIMRYYMIKIRFLMSYIRLFILLKKMFTGTSTSGLGGLDHQEVPSMVLQLLLCIGTNNDIIPDDYELPKLGNVKMVVMRSGYKAMNHFFNLRRTSFTEEELIKLDEQGQSVHYDFILLFRMKCILLENSSNYGGLINLLKNVCFDNKNVLFMLKNVFYRCKMAYCITFSTDDTVIWDPSDI